MGEGGGGMEEGGGGMEQEVPGAQNFLSPLLRLPRTWGEMEGEMEGEMPLEMPLSAWGRLDCPFDCPFDCPCANGEVLSTSPSRLTSRSLAGSTIGRCSIDLR